MPLPATPILKTAVSGAAAWLATSRLSEPRMATANGKVSALDPVAARVDHLGHAAERVALQDVVRSGARRRTGLR